MSRLILPIDERREKPLWLNYSFMLMWVNVAASGFGDRLIELAAMPMLGIEATHAQAAAIQARIYFFFFLPWLIITPLGGWLADTLPRKFILFACDLGRALVLFYAFTLVPRGLHESAIPHARVWEVYLVLMVVGALAAIFSPAKSATVPQVVPLSQLQPANSIILGIGVIASLVSFVIGGPLIDHYSVRAAILAATVAYGTSGWFFLPMRLHGRTPGSGAANNKPRGQFHRMMQAAHYLRTHRPARDLAILAVVLWAAANVLAVALSALCKNRYEIPADIYMSHLAWMMGATGAGMLVGALVLAWINERRETGLVIMTAMLPVGAGMALLAFNRFYSLGLVLGFLVGVFGNMAMIGVDVLMQSITPNFIRGRVFGLRDMMAMVSAVVVYLIVWLLPDSDAVMIHALYGLAILTPIVAAIGYYRVILRGRQPTRLANLFQRIGRLYALVWHRLRWIGKHHIPAHGPVILASNHTTAVDPLLIQACSPRLVRWVMLTSFRFSVLDVLWRTIRPIALHEGQANLPQLRQMLRGLQAGEIMGIFPEGQLQRDHRELQPFAPGVAMLAQRSGALIVPVWIEGTPRKYHILWHFLTASRSTIVFGQPFKPAPGASHQEVMDDLKKRMLELRDGLAAANQETPSAFLAETSS